MLLGKGPSGETHTQQMDDLSDTIIGKRPLNSKAAKKDWQEGPLDWAKV
jgi:hypothetical protein